MSVSKTDYVLVGVRLPFIKMPDFDDDPLEKYYDNSYKSTFTEDLVIISDGMGSRYTFIGKVIAKVNYDDWGGLKIMDAVEELRKHYDDVKEKFWKHENETIRSHAGKEISIYVFSHFH